MVINQIAQLVDLGGGNISPQQAILRMAGARFDYHAAVGEYLEGLRDGSSSSLSLPSGSDRGGDPDKSEGLGKGDCRVSDDTEEDPESTSAVRTIIVSL